MHSRLNDPNLKSKTYWKIIKSDFGHSEIVTVPPLIVNDQVFTTPVDKADQLNRYFAAQGELNLNNEPPLPTQVSINNAIIIEEIETTVEEVYAILIKLKNGKANGPDDINNLMLKFCAPILAEPLAHVFLINPSLLENFRSCGKLQMLCLCLNKVVEKKSKIIAQSLCSLISLRLLKG